MELNFDFIDRLNENHNKIIAKFLREFTLVFQPFNDMTDDISKMFAEKENEIEQMAKKEREELTKNSQEEIANNYQGKTDKDVNELTQDDIDAMNHAHQQVMIKQEQIIRGQRVAEEQFWQNSFGRRDLRHIRGMQIAHNQIFQIKLENGVHSFRSNGHFIGNDNVVYDSSGRPLGRLYSDDSHFRRERAMGGFLEPYKTKSEIMLDNVGWKKQEAIRMAQNENAIIVKIKIFKEIKNYVGYKDQTKIAYIVAVTWQEQRKFKEVVNYFFKNTFSAFDLKELAKIILTHIWQHLSDMFRIMGKIHPLSELLKDFNLQLPVLGFIKSFNQGIYDVFMDHYNTFIGELKDKKAGLQVKNKNREQTISEIAQEIAKYAIPDEYEISENN